jgi:putative membrane protein
MRFLLKFVLSVIGIVAVTKILPGVHINNWETAAILVIVLAILNLIIKPILIILTIPITILTLGLFLLVINAMIILAADYLIQGFYVDGFIWALIFSLVLSLIHWLIDSIVPERKD